jgi:hypothetical protein
MSDELTLEEKERLRKAVVVGKVSLGIALKWTWLFVLVFLALFAGFSWYLVKRLAQSGWRYTATSQMLYMPLQESKVPAMGDKQLYRVLDRRSLKRRVGEKIPLPQGEKSTLASDLEIKQEWKPTNVFTLTARSGSREAALRKVNTYAAVLISEYGEWRVKELNRWGGDATERRTAMRVQLAELEQELVDLRTQAGTDSPVEAQTALTTLIGEERRNLLMLDVEIATAEKTRETLEGEDPERMAVLIERAPELRKLKASMEELDSEIAKLRQVYTDLNPRVQGKLEDREALEKRYKEIVAECGGEDPGEGRIEQFERAQMSMMDVASKIDALKEARANLEETLSRNEARVQELMELTPRVSLLLSQRLELNHALVELDEQINSMVHMRENAESELQQIERAERVAERNPHDKETFVLAAAGAGACTAGLALVTVGLGLLFGRVRGARELAVEGDIRVLGSLPRWWLLHRRQLKEAMGVVANHFVAAEEAKGSVLVCRLKGAKPQPKFDEELDWALSMAGARAFTLTVVPQGSRDVPEEGAETMLNTVRKGARGWFPVVNRYSLAPTELQMLRADMEALRTEFDCIFVAVHGGLRHGGDFTGQLLDVCNSALLVVGANRTRRSELSYVRRLVRASGRPMLGLVTGAKSRVVRRELEESRWQ